MGKLNAKQEKFCREYIIDLNATQAAIRAGYSEATAAQTASRLLSKVKIQERIAELQEDAMNKVEIDAQNVLKSILEIRERCMQKEPVMMGKGEDRRQMTDYNLADEEANVWKFDASNALKANELLGKHLKLFTDKVETTGEQSINIQFDIPRPNKNT